MGAGQFAHIPESDIRQAFTDVENGAVEPFEYSFPAHPQHACRDMRKEKKHWWPWECRFAVMRHQYGDAVSYSFFAEPMARLLWRRHGCLCGLCMNPTAKYRVRGLSMHQELQIGKNGDESDRFPNACEACLKLALLDTWFTEDQFILNVRKELNKPDSPLLSRLRSAPRLRFEPRRAA